MPESKEKEILSLDGLCIGYGETVARVHWSLRKGEFWVIHGPNGCGKSTLLKTVLGLISPIEGQVRWNEKLPFGYIPQSVGIHPSVNLRVQDFISMGSDALSRDFFFGPRKKNHGANASVLKNANGTPSHNAEIHKKTVVDRLGLEGILASNFWDLSGGQQRRAILARTLMVNPEVLVVDEPSSGLDRPSALRFYEELDRLHKEDGKTILLVSHEDHYLSEIQKVHRLEFDNDVFSEGVV